MNLRPPPTPMRRLLTGLVALLVLAGLGVANRPVMALGAEKLHEFQINRESYKARYGHWSMLPVPDDFKVNAIHAALLHTGKVLIIAGSGNDRTQFEAGTFRTILWDPLADRFSTVPTPTDVFCAGHTFLPDGKLLIAGGTKSYEVLKDKITHPVGVLKIKNEYGTGGPRTIAKGTRVVGDNGFYYRTRAEVTVPQAVQMSHGGKVMQHAGEVEVLIDAELPGNAAVVEKPALYRFDALTGADRQNVYGVAEKITREKQEYGGDKTSYEFDPVAERYVRTGDLVKHRWYPTLAPLPDGDVLAVSGLDEFGRMLPGDNERYRAAEKKWVAEPKLKRVFPSYPALFGTTDGRLFFSGSNSGYGSDTEGRDPGFWNVADNSFRKVPGLRAPTMTETSASVLLPPAQDQKVMILGGGAVGESPVSTARTDIVDLDERRPAFTPGPDLPVPTRYLNTVVLPDDTVFTTGGSSGYRGGPYGGQARSDVLAAQIYHPRRNAFVTAAKPTVGRNYHAEALLLPDGRVVTLGSDPLYDETGTNPGTFEQRIEIYSPPYLFQGRRPALTGGPEQVRRGTTATFATPDPARIAAARLVRPSAVTHVTDVDQRSIALGVTRGGGTVRLSVPVERGLVPPGWYMLFVTDASGVPSVARWVQVT